MENPKLSKGIMEGSCGIIQKGMRGARLYIAEGPETGASIAMADSKASVLVSFGIANMKNLNSIIKTYNTNDIIIAGDNDYGSNNTQQQIETTIELYKQNNIAAQAIIPNLINNKKTDWNDVLLKQGVAEIQKQLLRNTINNISNKAIGQVMPELLTRVDFNKSAKLDGIDTQSLRDVSMLLDKDKNLNQLVAAYNKTTQLNDSKNALSVDRASAIKIDREVDIDL